MDSSDEEDLYTMHELLTEKYKRIRREEEALYDREEDRYNNGQSDDEIMIDILKNNETGYSINAPDEEDGFNILQKACFDGETETVKHLLQSEYVDVNWKDWYGNTPLSLACNEGYSEIASMLLADPRIQIDESNDEILCLVLKASYSNCLPTVEVLLASRRSIDTKKRVYSDPWMGATVYECARKRGYTVIADLIESYDKNPVKVSQELRKKLGLQENDIGELFALVVYFTDGYLRSMGGKESDPFPRFLSIAARLPLELQMQLCHRVFGSMGIVVKTGDSEPAFKRYAQE